MTHICVRKLTIIGSNNGLWPERRQAVIRNNAGILLIGPLGTNFSEILIGIQTFSLKKIHLKMSSAKCRPFCLGLNVLNVFLLCSYLFSKWIVICSAPSIIISNNAELLLIEINFKSLSHKWVWKCGLQNGGHFVSSIMCTMCFISPSICHLCCSVTIYQICKPRNTYPIPHNAPFRTELYTDIAHPLWDRCMVGFTRLVNSCQEATTGVTH